MSSREPRRYSYIDAATRWSPLRSLCVWLLAATALAGAGAALATPFVTYVVSCEAFVGGGTGSGASDCASVSNFFSPTPATLSDNAFFSTVASPPYASGNAAASYAAVADYGHLGIGFVAAAVLETQQSGCAPGIICASPLSIANSASAVSFADDILIQSSSLAIGTPVTIGFAFPLTGTLDISAFGGLNAPQVSGYISVGYGFSGPNTPGINACWVLGVVNSGCSTDASILFGTFAADVGDSLSIAVQMLGSAQVQASANYPTEFPDAGASDGTVAGDFSHTLLTFFNPQDSSVTLLSSSGHDYLQPANGVPEPATLALFGIGLAGLAFSLRCKLG